ncbi:hypothetical protein DCAR_0519107 [Daucus carota subsp. sativus]|uniref:Uncharacterized protein n=1 Tax=Daucus carota subsp. sativus TaxID=79200 RepID=A0AAF1B0A2_DAUCS|nr:PREDICTED: uncharacterized protein LOC108223596 [Daucus carota subsp. sativus]WOG99752.1 hypothetical protein DCAR_0519107 [Daucus carota subsp. sativus]
MTCIASQLPLSTVISHIKQTHQMKKTFIFHNALQFELRQHHTVSPLRTKALASSLLLGVAVESSSSPAAAYSGDLQVLLRTTTGLLFVYWIANFVVPELIMKDLQSDKTDEDQETKQNDSTD